MVDGRDREQIEGWIPELASEAELARRAGEGLRLSRRRDHHAQGRIARGRLHLRSAQRRDAGRVGRAAHPAEIRSQKISIPYSDIAALAFSGRDTAAGKSWEAWVRKYWEKKAAGEKGIALEPEKLE